MSNATRLVNDRIEWEGDVDTDGAIHVARHVIHVEPGRVRFISVDGRVSGAKRLTDGECLKALAHCVEDLRADLMRRREEEGDQ